MDIDTGECTPFGGTHEFEPWGSLMIVEDGISHVAKTTAKATLISLGDTLAVAEPIQNVLTLDCCDYYFDGVLQEKNGYVLNICERANALERNVHIHQDYHVRINSVPQMLHMACETPEKFDIAINGTKIDKTVCGYFRDKSFRTIDITQYIREGENTISFDCDFAQSAAFYDNLRKAYRFESEKNKLAYDMEIEAIYLLGNFSVQTNGTWEKLQRNAVRYCGTFVLEAPRTAMQRKHMEQQGYPFFCGEMHMEGEIDIVGENPVLELDMKGINAVKAEINGKTKVMLTDGRLPLAEFGISGKTKIKLTLINNLRNLLGPHHLAEGESWSVGPTNFFREPCVWNRRAKPEDWNDGYCFVETSI